MKQYNKLVRDNIVNMIQAEGRDVRYKVLEDDEYRQELNRKLKEEVTEYEEGNSVEELADIVEVIYGLLDSMGVTKEEFEKIRTAKVEKRGAFKKKLYLEEAE